MTVKELKKIAKAQGVKGYSRMRKAELEKILNVPATPATLTVKVLRQLAKNANVKGYSRMKKAELLAIVNAQPATIETAPKKITVADFEKAFEKFVFCGDRARVCDLRRELNTTTEDFDNMVKELRDTDKYYPAHGDHTLLTMEECRMDFIDENNFRYGLIVKAA